MRNFALQGYVCNHQNYHKLHKPIYEKLFLRHFLSTLLFTCTISEIRLNQLDISRTVQQFGTPSLNKSVDGVPLMVNSVTYQYGLGVQAPAHVKVHLARNTQQFVTLLGVTDHELTVSKNAEMIPFTDGSMLFYKTNGSEKQYIGIGKGDRKLTKGSVIFRVLADGKEVYNSGIIRGGDQVKELSLDTKGVNDLELICDNAADGLSGDHAAWLNARFIYSDLPPRVVDVNQTNIKLPMPKATEQWLAHKMAHLTEVSLPLEKNKTDWLIDNKNNKTQIYQTHQGKDIVLSNGLVARVFRIMPNLATIDLCNLMSGESLLRAVSCEGELVINDKKYAIGGLAGQAEFGYTMYNWVDSMWQIPNSFRVIDFEVSDIQPHVKWANKRWSLEKKWTASGKVLSFTLEGPHPLHKVQVKLHYALYDGLPVISKWMEVINQSGTPLQLNSFSLEQLAITEPESPVEAQKPEQFRKPNIHVESDWAFLGFTEKEAERTEFWETDPRYTSQCNYPMLTPCLLNVKLPMGPNVTLAADSSFTSFRNWMMPFDSDDRDRKGLFVKRMYRKIAPWVTENPIFLHCTSSKPEIVKEAIDQCVATGYEMVILSFGSGLNMEDESFDNLSKFKTLTQYATSKGIELGGYSLLSSRWISDEVDVINSETGKRGGMIFGSSPCLSSDWGYDYFQKIQTFFDKTGMSVFENDGSYPGNVCASTQHAHHKGLLDSQWEQRKQIANLYKWMCEKGIYTNVPDFGYLLNGTNKVGIGYREVNWSLPRERQLVLGRQVMYDGLWERLPSMCWTFVPLTEYHGGGPAATLEPLSKHLTDYKAHMIQNYGSGVQACYRGHRLYDTDQTKQTVTEVISWYKKYRDILNSEIIHLRRPDGKDYDAIMHVNPELNEKAFVMLYNPSAQAITRTIEIPLYYSGLSEKAMIQEQEGTPKAYLLDKQNKVTISIQIPAQGYNWLVVR